MDIEITHGSIARKWWGSKRYSYNKGLFISVFIAFLLYSILGEIIIAPHEEFEVTIFVMAFQGMAYLFMIGVANIFYCLGYLADIEFNKTNNQLFRERLFRLGYWFSFALPILFILGIVAIFLFRDYSVNSAVSGY